MSDELKIIHYPHPTLRHKSKPLKRVDNWLKTAIGRMFELMYEANGIGLAANQVNLPYRFFIMNLASDPEEKEMEQVFINPVISLPKGSEEGEEGCLSLPGLYADVTRPERVKVSAYDLSGQEIEKELEGLEARVVQHETDHLEGVLFIDRLSETSKIAVREKLEEFEDSFVSEQQQGLIPDEATIVKRLRELEGERT